MILSRLQVTVNPWLVHKVAFWLLCVEDLSVAAFLLCLLVEPFAFVKRFAVRFVCSTVSLFAFHWWLWAGHVFWPVTVLCLSVVHEPVWALLIFVLVSGVALVESVALGLMSKRIISKRESPPKWDLFLFPSQPLLQDLDPIRSLNGSVLSYSFCNRDTLHHQSLIQQIRLLSSSVIRFFITTETK